MAKHDTKNYRIDYEDGVVQYLQLNAEDADAWRARAKDKGSEVKKVTEADPEPVNPA